MVFFCSLCPPSSTKFAKSTAQPKASKRGRAWPAYGLNSDGALKLNVDGTVTTVASSPDPTFSTAKIGELAVSNLLDPIYGNAVNSFLLQGYTATKTDYNNFIDYLAVSVEPDTANSGIYTGRETLMYLPATNTHKVNQIYAGEDFIQSFSDLGASALFGRYVSIENYAGPITGRATALSLNVENDAEGVTINGTRGMYVRGAQNYAATSTITTHEAIKIDAGHNDGTVVNNYGLHIIDQTLGGTVSGVNQAINVNDKLVVGPDGSTLYVNGTVQSAFKSLNGTAGVTAGPFTVVTAIAVTNGIVTTLTGS